MLNHELGIGEWGCCELTGTSRERHGRREKRHSDGGQNDVRRSRSEKESNQWGRMVVIDVNTDDYELGDKGVTTTPRLLERNLVGCYLG